MAMLATELVLVASTLWQPETINISAKAATAKAPSLHERIEFVTDAVIVCPLSSIV
ncbi:MAG: hypothetical protein ABIQ51_22420 [Mesorhizobium sp.]